MLIYGKQVVLHVLEKHPQLIEEVMFSKTIDKKLFSKFARLDKNIVILDNKKAQGLAGGGNHQGFFLKIKDIEPSPLQELKKLPFLLVLDGLNDMGNIGAIARSAYSLGIDGIILSGTNDFNIQTALRTSSGALLDIPFYHQKDIYTLANELKQAEFYLLGADANGLDIEIFKKQNNTNKLALFLGNENMGFSRRLSKMLDKIVKISMENDFNSLNVSVAAGILMYELKVQK